MAFSIIADMCAKNCITQKNAQKVALPLDLVTSVALFVIGILALAGTINLTPSASWALIGAGVCYAGLVCLKILATVKKNCNATKEVFWC